MNRNGFTLVEMIAVLLILGIVGAAGTLGFADAIRGFVFAEDTGAMAQKAMATMNRISTEITHLEYNPPPSHALHDDTLAVGYEVTNSSDTSMTFNANYGQSRGTASAVTIAWANDQITINGNVLCDDVTRFDFDYLTSQSETGEGASSFAPLTTKIVDVSFDITGASGVTKTFSTRIVPKFPY